MNVNLAPAPVLDEARLREVLAFLELHPELWNQDHYACGSTGCLAGWTVALAERTTIAGLRPHDRQYPEIAERAMELLGLTVEQASDLFTFAYVHDRGDMRHPTFAEFCVHVEDVTGVRFKEPAGV